MKTPKGTIIIGASSGIGRATAKHLKTLGVPVFIGSRNEETLSATAQELDLPFQTVDASKEDSLKNFFTAASETLDEIDSIICCAGSILLKPAHLTSTDEFIATFENNLLSAFLTVKLGTQLLKRDGSIVLFSTAAASTGIPNHEAIASAKAGVEGLIRSSAATYAPRKIRINGIAPGLTESSMSQFIFSNEPSRKASEAMHAMGRLGVPEDFTDALLWLISSGSGWMSGEVLHIDGGLSGLRSIQRAKG